MASVDEQSPLLGEHSNGAGDESGAGQKQTRSGLWSPINALLVVCFLVATSFNFTQIPILFLFQKMVCEDYYDHHPPFEGPGNRCNRPQIDAPAAQHIAILSMATNLCGTINLFVAGWLIKRVGPKAALAIQVAFPSIRVLVQLVGAIIGGRTGIIVIQSSQLTCIIGGPAGYLLVLNTCVSELALPSERTGAFGRLQGAGMLGTAIGSLTGSIIGDIFDVVLPFKVGFCSFLLSCLYIATFAPYISPESMSRGDPAAKGIGAFFAPLKILAPQRMLLPNGKAIMSWGITFLAIGVFVGVLATGYAPIMIQMYAMSRFGFHPSQNGYLMAVGFVARAIFLMLIFPAIITKGRKVFAQNEEGRKGAPQSRGEGSPPPRSEEFEEDVLTLSGQETSELSKPAEEESGQAFDLFFLRWSLVVDGAITATAGLVTAGWQIYLIGALLPLASGSAPAAKGVITEMCAPSRRPDAIQAITLMENLAILSTLAVFGSVFSLFTELERPELTFFCNAGVAMIAVGILLLSRFPPPGSTYEDKETGNPVSSQEVPE